MRAGRRRMRLADGAPGTSLVGVGWGVSGGAVGGVPCHSGGPAQEGRSGGGGPERCAYAARIDPMGSIRSRAKPDPFGSIRIHSDPFGSIRIHSDLFGSVRIHLVPGQAGSIPAARMGRRRSDAGGDGDAVADVVQEGLALLEGWVTD
jgi:hypothetical protein